MHGFLNLVYRFYPLAIAGLLAAWAIWLERAIHGHEPAFESVINQTPDFVAETVRITGFAEDGKWRYTLDSPRITHLPVTDSARIEQPRLQLIGQGRHMRVDADHGDIGPKGEQIDFSGNVKVEREGAPLDPPMRLSSAQLTVWPQEQRAASSVPVHLTQGEIRADADNLVADNVFGIMRLSGKVKMHLVARHQRNP
ncbi:MAG: LPS export ABC transporter periplasmic protein LptC [Azoarcus sp.]|jgi:lipopolysaccharide export system protein LptC|nr:LPS export ABC transporter periplasmic protein LptC [Azoarcus sp.]